MDIGQLRHRITVQGYIETKDRMGGGQREYYDKFSCWASIEPKSGDRLYQAMAVKQDLTHTIRIRYREDVSIHDRVKYGNRFFYIESMVPDALKTELVLECSEVVE